MKTFKDLKVGDYFFDLDPVAKVVFRNEIIEIESFDYGKILKWTDNNGCSGRTVIGYDQLNSTVIPGTFITSCASTYDIINLLCNS